MNIILQIINESLSNAKLRYAHNSNVCMKAPS